MKTKIHLPNYLGWQNGPKGWPVLAALACSVLASDTLAQTYTLTDLGTLGGGDSRAYGINNFGQVIGTANNGEFYTLKYCQFYCANLGCAHLRWVCNDNSLAKQRAFLWTPSRPGGTSGAMIDLGTLGGPNGHPVNLSQSGSVVGYSNTRHVSTYGGRDIGYSSEFYQNHGFLWTPDQPNTTRGSMDLDPFSPAAINSSGQMVSGRFLRQGAVTTDLGAVNARSINDLGQVVGGSLIVSNGHSHAFLWQNGILSDLGTLPGYTDSDAYDINTNGQVIGECYINDGSGYDSPRGFLFALDSSGSVTSRVDLGTLPSPYYSWRIAPRSINNRGEVVGYGYSQSASIGWAFLWDIDHGMRDLNTLIPTNSGWHLFQAWGINDHGQIAASLTLGYYYSPSGAVLLTPLAALRLWPEPWQPNGQFRFTLVGEAGRSYTIQASTNLVNWTALTNFVSATGTNLFSDPAAPTFSRRFYRAVTP